MVDHLNDAIKMLVEHRKSLIEQLDAIDRAIDALRGPERRSGAMVAAAPAPPSPSRRRKRQFAPTEEHKRKLVNGRKRAREAREAKQTASHESAPLVSAWKADGPPRLVRHEPDQAAHPDPDTAHERPSARIARVRKNALKLDKTLARRVADGSAARRPSVRPGRTSSRRFVRASLRRDT